MEDVQDGIKVSIQDGVTDDPTIPTYEKGKGATLSMNAGIPIDAHVMKSSFASSVNTHITKVATMVSVVSSAVT